MKNLPRIRIYSFVSLDGYTAATDGSMEWLADYMHGPCGVYDFAGFRNDTACVLMSGIYYAALQAADLWPFGDKPCYVVSPLDMGSEPGREIEYLIEDIGRLDDMIEKINGLRNRAGGDIWLAGDNMLISSLMDRDLIDELIVNIVPVMIGNGCRLLNGNESQFVWILDDCRKLNDDIIQLKYMKKNVRNGSGYL